MLDLYLPVVFLVVGSVVAELFFRLRGRMTKDHKFQPPISYYTRKRVFRFSFYVLFMLIGAFLTGMVLVLSLELRSGAIDLTLADLSTLLFYLICWVAICFGCGLYVSGVFVEQYSMIGLRDEAEYSRLKVATKILHGQLSHVLVFSGGMAAIFFLSLLEIDNPLLAYDPLYFIVYSTVGLGLGILYYKSQIRNLTWRHQLPFFFLLFLIALFLLVYEPLKDTQPFRLFFLIFSGVSSLGLLHHFIQKKF